MIKCVYIKKEFSNFLVGLVHIMGVFKGLGDANLIP